MNSNSVNGVFQKKGNTVIANLNGVAGSAINSIPLEYRPPQDVYAPILALSNSTNRYYFGYINFRSNGTIDGGAFPSYGVTASEVDEILSNNIKIYCIVSWVV